jgi:hypothetical protein
MSLRTIKMALVSAAVGGTLVTSAGAIAYEPSPGDGGPGQAATKAKTNSEASSPRVTASPGTPAPAGSGGFGGGHAEPQLDRMSIAIASLAPKVAAKDTSPRTKAILTKLEQPISMNFADETPLEDVLKYIKSVTHTANDSGIPIYVDPIGLQEAEKTTTSPITLDLRGVPLKTTLRLMLKQLGLAYCVKDGLLIISSPHGIYQELLEGADAQTLEEGLRNGLFPGMGGMGGMGMM